jgi:putative transposase
MARVERIESANEQLSISEQCRLLNLPRASYYRVKHQGPATLSAQVLLRMRLIDELYTRYPFYGSRQIRNHLRREGHTINRKTVQRLMRKMGVRSVAPSPNTSLGNKAHTTYPYLLNGLTINQPNQVWCTDITYIRMRGGFVYLVAIMDWHSRRVLSWALSNSMDTSFCISALEQAIRLHGKPEIFNSDQGAQFTSKAFTQVLKDNGITISMDGKGRWMDNVFIERLWRSVKYEEIYLNEYSDASSLRQSLTKYFEFYNHQRPHQSLGCQTPAEIYCANDTTYKEAA